MGQMPREFYRQRDGLIEAGLARMEEACGITA